MKRKLIITLTCFVSIFIIVFVDYSIAKYKKNKPLFSIKEIDTDKQMETYSGLFYKIYTCTADNGIYETKSIFSKVNYNFCPKEYKIEFKYGYYTNNMNTKISKENYEQLKQFYSNEQIVNMTENDLNDALNNIENWKPITN